MEIQIIQDHVAQIETLGQYDIITATLTGWLMGERVHKNQMGLMVVEQHLVELYRRLDKDVFYF